MSGAKRLSTGIWLDVAHQALLSLGDRRFRTFLSISGIAIGIAAVTLIGVVTQGGKQVVFGELETFGLRSVWVFRDTKLVDPRKVERPGSGIDNDDFAVIRGSSCCAALVKLTPVVYGVRGTRPPPSLARVGRLYSHIHAEGVGSDYLSVNNDAIVQGRAFTTDDTERGRHLIIIGDQVRKDLFGDRVNPLGEEVRLGDEKFEIIGVLGFKDRSLLSSIGSAGGQDANGRVLIPYRRMQAIVGSDQIDVLQGEVAANADPKTAAGNLMLFLRQRHRDAYAYRSETMDQYVQTARIILGGVSTIGVVAASVSLIVAGLGILNIMSTSVLERTREIGVRKALGGTEREILLQFLFEACMISSTGGVTGLVLGGAVSVAIATLTGFPLTPSPGLIVLALLVAVAVGLISGLYPAYRAARLRPVEALRYE